MPRLRAEDDGALIVRAKLALGRLRRDACTIDSVIELGNHRICDGCDRPILPSEAEMRAQFADGGTLRFHAPCFATWYTETQRSGRSRPSPLPSRT
jgi:hypothetical protein